MLAGRVMVAPPAEELVGRTAELAAVDEALAALERGRALALALADDGEPGIGKTSLLAALDARAEERGLLVLSGSASELESDLPFAVFADALDDYVQALEPARLAQLAPDVRAELGQVLPSLDDGAAPAAPQDHRFRTHRAVRRLLEVLAGTKPLVLVLDDMHWADSGSIEHEHERLGLGEHLQQPPHRAVRTEAVVLRPGRRGSARERRQHLAELRADVGRERVEPPRLERLHVVVERVGEDAEREVALELGGASREHEQPALLAARLERVEQAGLADAGLADDGQGAGAPPLQPDQRVVDGRELSRSPDELLGRWGNHDASGRA